MPCVEKEVQPHHNRDHSHSGISQSEASTITLKSNVEKGNSKFSRESTVPRLKINPQVSRDQHDFSRSNIST